MLNLPPLAQTLIIAVLFIGYFITFFFQKNKIEVLKNTVTALKELTDGQKNHITTYKEMVSLDTIREHFELQKKAYMDNAFELISESKQTYYEPIEPDYLEYLKEMYYFLAYLFYAEELDLEGRLTEKKRTEIISIFFPMNKEWLDFFFVTYQETIDAQKSPTQ